MESRMMMRHTHHRERRSIIMEPFSSITTTTTHHHTMFSATSRRHMMRHISSVKAYAAAAPSLYGIHSQQQQQHRLITTHHQKEIPLKTPQHETIPTEADSLRSQYLHQYKKEHKENYLGKELVSSIETEGRVRGSIVMGWLQKWLLPKEFLNHRRCFF